MTDKEKKYADDLAAAKRETELLTGAEKYWYDHELKRLKGIKWTDIVTEKDLIKYALEGLKVIKRFKQPILLLMEGYANQKLNELEIKKGHG